MPSEKSDTRGLNAIRKEIRGKLSQKRGSRSSLNTFKITQIIDAIPLAKRAYESYLAQRRRCYVKSNKRYKYYGAKGIRVEYETKEFIFWWLKSAEKIRDKKDITVSRIDHSRNYCFENIRLESRQKNSSECINRVGNPGKKRRIIISVLKYPSLTPYFTAFSLCDAAGMTGVQVSRVWCACNGKHRVKSSRGYTFRYYKPSAIMN